MQNRDTITMELLKIKLFMVRQIKSKNKNCEAYAEML